jgi:hypothetical protein
VTIAVARAEMHDATSANPRPTVRVLFDSSLKGYLDKYRPEGLKCGAEPIANILADPVPTPIGAPPDPSDEYNKVRRLVVSTLSETMIPNEPYPLSSKFYLLEIETGMRFYLDNNFAIEDILCEEPLPENRPVQNVSANLCEIDGFSQAQRDENREKRAGYEPGDLNDSHLAVEFNIPGNIDPKKTLMLIANVKGIADGKSADSPQMIKVEKASRFDSPPKEISRLPDKDPTPDVRGFLMDPTKAKNANVGVSFALTGSRGNRVYSHDFAIQLGRIHRLGLRGAYDIIPFFLEHKFARDEKSPKDELRFGAKLNHLLLFDPYSSKSGKPERDIFNSITTTLSGYIESDFFFSDRANLIGSWKSGLPVNLFDERSTAMRVTPFIGYEFGARLKDENVQQKSRYISRGLMGVDIFLAPWRREKTNPFEIELNYIRRVLATREPAYFVNVAGKEVLGEYSNTPKEFVKARLTFNYNDRFAPYFQYSYGKTPPKYTLQNSVMEAGLKFYLKWEK